MDAHCQSCRQAPVVAIETPAEFPEPLRLCRNCRRRLDTHSLRPREWYNLCSIHGTLNDLLGEEAYDPATGAALAPAQDVPDVDRMPAPSLAEVTAVADDLLTYALVHSIIQRDTVIARRALPEEITAALQRHAPETLLAALSNRLRETTHPDFVETILVICAEVLRETGARLIRARWEAYGPAGLASDFRGLAFAAARCLPPTEACERIAAVLDRMPAGDRSIWKSVLIWLEPPFALDWIEEHAFGPVDTSWGVLAAWAGLDWPRARRWILGGRPLSLIALDALGHRLQRAPELRGARELPPLGLTDPAELTRVLERCAAEDPAPRVQRSVNLLRGMAARSGDPA